MNVCLPSAIRVVLWIVDCLYGCMIWPKFYHSTRTVILLTGTDLAYTDTSNIQPFITYTYTLVACTVIGCTESLPVSIYLLT